MKKTTITKEMLNGEGNEYFGTGIITDEEINYYGWGNSKKPLKFVIVRGGYKDWAIYLESMDRDMTYKEVREEGNKITDETTIKLLVDCDEEVFGGYRY